jgi:hypothetical protein
MTDLVSSASRLVVSQEPAAFRLYASPESRGAGGRDALVATFASEQEARDVFRAVRLSSHYRDGWAELIALNGSKEPRRICWFGDDPSPSKSPVPTAGRSYKGASMQTKEKQAALVAKDKRAAGTGRRRSGQAVALVVGFVAVLAFALAALAIAVFGGDDGGASEPNEPVIPFVVDKSAPPVLPNPSVDG